MEGIYSPAEGHVEAGKGHIIKTRSGVVVVASIFLSVYLCIDLIRWWHSHRPTVGLLRVSNSNLMWPRFCSF